MNRNFRSVIVLIFCCLSVSAQQRWSRLPSFSDVLLGISYSMNNNSIPDKINNFRPPPISKNLFILSAAFQTDEEEYYSRYQPSAAFAGDLLWASGDVETDMSLLTGGLLGNYDRGVVLFSDGTLRLGGGGTVEDFVMATDAYDYGYHLAVGPNIKGDYLLTDTWFLRATLKYTFSFWHFVNENDPDKSFQEKAKNPGFFTFDIQAISNSRLNLRLEYWSAVSNENAGLSLNRLWLHATVALSRTRDI